MFSKTVSPSATCVYAPSTPVSLRALDPSCGNDQELSAVAPVLFRDFAIFVLDGHRLAFLVDHFVGTDRSLRRFRPVFGKHREVYSYCTT